MKSKDNPTAQDLLNFFNEKFDAVRRSTGGGPVQTSLPPTVKKFDTPTPVTADDVITTITSVPLKSCDLDPLPTDVLKEFLPELLPSLSLSKMCNKSLSQGCLPHGQRHAIVTPCLKKTNADRSHTKNYRPISIVTFMSNVVERLVCRQFVAYLKQHGLLSNLQSVYRKHHSTETAVLKVVQMFCWQLTGEMSRF